MTRILLYVLFLSSIFNSFSIQIDKKHVIELYCKLDLASYHQEIGECLMSAAFEALETHVEVCGTTLIL